MAERTVTAGRAIILYDDVLTDHAGTELFSARHWGRHTGLRGMASGGRGNTWIVGGVQGDWVLRHYRRGGWAAKFSTDFYWWTGLEHARPWREWRLLDSLYKEGLPVPRPVAAQVVRRGWLYRGDVITCLIPGCRSLAEAMKVSGMQELPWAAIGRCIRRFHDAGVFHADLNAHNILLDEQGRIFLVDFDKGARRTLDRRWQRANLKRLRRSLRKLSAAGIIDYGVWSTLLEGYRQKA